MSTNFTFFASGLALPVHGSSRRTSYRQARLRKAARMRRELARAARHVTRSISLDYLKTRIYATTVG